MSKGLMHQCGSTLGPFYVVSLSFDLLEERALLSGGNPGPHAAGPMPAAFSPRTSQGRRPLATLDLMAASGIKVVRRRRPRHGQPRRGAQRTAAQRGRPISASGHAATPARRRHSIPARWAEAIRARGGRPVSAQGKLAGLKRRRAHDPGRLLATGPGKSARLRPGIRLSARPLQGPVRDNRAGAAGSVLADMEAAGTTAAAAGGPTAGLGKEAGQEPGGVSSLPDLERPRPRRPPELYLFSMTTVSLRHRRRHKTQSSAGAVARGFGRAEPDCDGSARAGDHESRHLGIHDSMFPPINRRQFRPMACARAC